MTGRAGGLLGALRGLLGSSTGARRLPAPPGAHAGSSAVGGRRTGEQPSVDDVWQGLAVFLLQGPVEADLGAVRVLDREGLEVIDVVRLDPAQQLRLSARLRGGPRCAGQQRPRPWMPTTCLVAYDVAVERGGADEERAAGGRVRVAEEQLRVQLLADSPARPDHDLVRASDGARQALDFLEALGDPAATARLRSSVQDVVEACRFPYPVVRALPGQARRARVAVVDHPTHGHAVCKLFRPGAARFLERELRARQELSHLTEVPDLLEHGQSWILTTLYEDDRSHVRRRLLGRQDVQLTAGAVDVLVRFATDLHARGLFLLDLSTHNLVTDPLFGLKVLDWEFLQEYESRVPELRDSYTFRGVPAGPHPYDVPLRTLLTEGAGGTVFHPAVSGSSVDSLLEPPRHFALQRRALVQLVWYAVFLRRRLQRAIQAPVSTGVSKVRVDEVDETLQGAR